MDWSFPYGEQASAGGGEQASAGGGKVMAEAGVGERASVSERRWAIGVADCGDWVSVGGGKVMSEVGVGDRESVGGAKVMAKGGNRVASRKVPKKCWKPKVMAVAGGGERASAGGGERASAGGGKLMAEVETGDLASVGVGMLMLEAESGDLASVGVGKVMAEAGSGDLPSVGGEKLMAEAGGGERASVGGGKVMAEAESGDPALVGVGKVMAEVETGDLASVGVRKLMSEAESGDLASVGVGKLISEAESGDLASVGGGKLMAEAGGGERASVGGGKVMAEAESGDPASVGVEKVMAEAGGGDLRSVDVRKAMMEGCDWVDWGIVQKQLLLRKKVTRESGGGDRASASLGNAMEEVAGIPKAIMEGCDWLDWGEVKIQLLRAKVIRESGSSDWASLDLGNVMAEVAGIPKVIMECCDWVEVLKKRLRAKVIREIKEKEAEGGDLASAGRGKVLEAGGGDLALAGEGKVMAEAEAGGGKVIMEAEAEAEAEGDNWVGRRRVPKKYLKAKTCVIWDMEKRPFPEFCKPAEIARFIRSVVSYMGFGGEVDIIAVGDTRIIKNQIDLLRSGIVVKFCDSRTYPPRADYVLAEILSWEFDNPTPGNILLISTDRSLSAVLRSISNDGYYIIRVREPKSTGYQAVGGSPDYWDWSDLQKVAGPKSTGYQAVGGSPDYWDWSDLQKVAGPLQKEASLGVAKATRVGGNWASRNRVDEKFLRAKTCVIWDIERRWFPKFCEPDDIAKFIKRVVSHLGFVGEVDIIAVGDTRKIKTGVAGDLKRSGIVLEHYNGGLTYPPGVFHQTSLWTEHNLPPANVMLISGHRRFSEKLSILSDEGYYIIRVRQDSTGPHTYAYVLDSWDWSDLLDAGTKKCLRGLKVRK